VLGTNDDGTVDVYSGGRKMRVAAMPEVLHTLKRGDEVALNESFSVILSRGHDLTGEVVTVKDNMGSGRALVVGRADEERVCELSSTPRSGRHRASRRHRAHGQPLGC
jgi:proteasome-associated ATPase